MLIIAAYVKADKHTVYAISFWLKAKNTPPSKLFKWRLTLLLESHAWQACSA